MRHIFADTSFFLALFEPSSKAHAAALQASEDSDQALVLTSAVLFELGAALSLKTDRALFIKLVEQLRNTPQHRIVHIDEDLETQAFDLFRKRSDKNWSLADCSSFVVMHELKLTDALTTDRHFKQAGFNMLLPETGD